MRVKSVVYTVVLIFVIAALAWPAYGLELPGSPESPGMFFPMNMFYGGSSPYTQSSNDITLSITGKVYVENVLVDGADVTVYVNGVQKAKYRAGQTYEFVIPGVHYGDTVEVMAIYSGFTGRVSKTVDKTSLVMDVRIARDNSFMSNAINMMPANDDATREQLNGIKYMQQNYQPQYTVPQRSSSWMSQFSNPLAIGDRNPAMSSYETFVKYSPGMKNIFA